MDETIEIQIERYINGEMDAEEVMNFEHRLEHDPEFKELYEATLAAHKVIEEAGRQELKYNMWSYENKPEKKPRVIKMKRQRLISIAASILIIFVAYTFFDQGGGRMSANEVFDTYYEPYNPPSVLRDNSGGDRRTGIRQFSIIMRGTTKKPCVISRSPKTISTSRW